MRIGEENLSSGNIGESGDAVVAESRIDHFAVLVEDHALEQRCADALRDRTFDLSAALHGVEDRSGVGSVDALQNANFSGDPIHGDAEAMNIEARRARRPVGFAHYAHLDAARRARIRTARTAEFFVSRIPPRHPPGGIARAEWM